MAELNMTAAEAGALASAIRKMTESVILGAGESVRLLTAALLCGGHVLIEDLPGTGKTTLVKAAAAAAGCDFHRIQCTPDLMPADITGYEMFSQKADGSREMVFRRGPVFTNILLADEINRMAPRSQSGLLECMAEHQVTAGGVRYALPEPFLVIATQNPIEMQGTFPLPEAQLDRFFMRLQMGQPPRALEAEILRGRQLTDPLDAVQQVADPQQILAAQQAVRAVTVSDAVQEYLLDIAEATRRHSAVRYGLSTRGLLALRRAAQGYAVTEGRDHVLPDDVKAVCTAVCAHRLHVTGGMLSDREAAEQVIASVLESVPVRKS